MSRFIGGNAGWFARIICGSALALLAISAHAASFNCSKAESQVERLICSTPVLSRLDEELAVVYREALSKVDDPAGLRVLQRSWINNTRNRCIDPQCIESAYRMRLVDLRSRIPTPGLAPTSSPPSRSEVAVTPSQNGDSAVAQTVPRSAPQQAKPKQDIPTIIFLLPLALIGAGGAIMPKRDRRYKTGYRNFSWRRVFLASGLYVVGFAIFVFNLARM